MSGSIADPEHPHRSLSQLHGVRAMLLVATLALVGAATAVAPPVVQAAGTTTLFLDSAHTVSGDGSVRSIDGPATASWDGTRLTVEYEPAAGSGATLTIAPKLGDDLVVGDYPIASGDPAPGQAGFRLDDCPTGSFKVLEISPVPEAGIASTVATLAVSFDQVCDGLDTLGEARVASAVALTAYAFVLAGVPTTDMVVAGDVPVGRSSTQRFTLALRGSEPLTLGTAGIIQTVETSFSDGWSIVADDCSGSTLEPGPMDRCSIDVRIGSWIPAPRILALKISANTDRGSIQVRLDGGVWATTFVPIEPTRIVDTRIGLGVAGSLKHRVSRSLVVVDRRPGDPERNVPADALAVAGNLTVTRQTSAGYVSLTTTPTNAPTTSTVNVPAGDTRANGVTIRLGGSATASNGAIGATWVGAAGSSAHVVFDVTGYFVPTAAPAIPKSGNFESVDLPIRALDTRAGIGLTGSFAANTTRTLTMDLPDSHDGAMAVAGNLTVIGATVAGYVSVGPTAADVKATSVINFPAGDVRANNTIVRLGPGNKIALRYTAPAGARVHLLFDVTGSFGAGSLGYVPLVQHRTVDTRTDWPGPLATGSRAGITVSRRSGDPAQRIPFGSAGLNFSPTSVVANATLVAPTRAGYVSFDGTWPPKTSAINSPAGDVRANGLIARIGEGQIPVVYVAAAGAKTHLLIDAYGYFAGNFTGP